MTSIDPDQPVQVNLRLPRALKEAAERTAASDHRSLTSLVEKLLADHVKSKPSLSNWHEAAHSRLIRILNEQRPEDGKKGVFVRSYSVNTPRQENLDPASLLRTLTAVHADLSSILSSPEMIYPYSRAELSPYFTYDPTLVRNISSEILEMVALPKFVRWPEFWRACPEGLVTDARSYSEDHKDTRQWNNTLNNWFSPLFMTRRLYALIKHAEFLASKFSSAVSVEFRCEWTGLVGRELRDHDPMADWLPGKIARVDGRVTSGEWEIDAVRMQWPEIASALGGPILRLFDPTFDYTAEWIRRQIQRIRQ